LPLKTDFSFIPYLFRKEQWCKNPGHVIASSVTSSFFSTQMTRMVKIYADFFIFYLSYRGVAATQGKGVVLAIGPPCKGFA